MMNKTPTHKRINISLPVETVALVDRIAKKGNRSHLIDQAVHFFMKEIGREKIKQELKEGACQRAERDSALCKEWFVLEDEICPKNPV
jgi:CopG family transcriptional regulator / antitoxin EndoAI